MSHADVVVPLIIATRTEADAIAVAGPPPDYGEQIDGSATAAAAASVSIREKRAHKVSDASPSSLEADSLLREEQQVQQ